MLHLSVLNQIWSQYWLAVAGACVCSSGKRKRPATAHINPTGGGSGLSYPDKQRQSAYQQKRKVNCEIRSLWKIVHAASMLLQYYYRIPAKMEYA